MLSHRQVATLRAALLFWQEEMCSHGEATMQPYYDESDFESLGSEEVSHLRNRLFSGLRFAIYDPEKEELPDRMLYGDRSEAEIVAGGMKIAAVILPPPED